jgi:hypothetical protein
VNAVKHGVPLVLLLACVATGAFFAGRGSVDRRTRPGRAGSFAAGYASGREDAFSGFDGGWAFGAPYIVTLRRGGPGITYRFARRWPMAPGVEYRVCGRAICRRKAR